MYSICQIHFYFAIMKYTITTSKGIAVADYSNDPVFINNSSANFDFERLSIIMGLNCNINCVYCFQREYAASHEFPNLTPSKVKDFLDHLKRCIDLNKLTTLYLWGGEPLVYWKTIVKIVEYLPDYMPNITRKVISTNLTLLTQEKLQFLYDHHFSIQVSDDGDNTQRGQRVLDVIEKKRQLLADFKEQHPKFTFSTHSTIGNSFPDYYRMTSILIKNYKELTNNFTIVPEWMPGYISLDKRNQEFVYDWETLDLIHDSVYKACIEYPEMLQQPIMQRRYKSFGTNIDTVSEYGCGFPKRYDIAIDANGTIYKCRASPYDTDVVATLDNYRQVYNQNMDQKMTKLSDKPRCKECCFRKMCHGICGMISNQNLEQVCRLHATYYYGLLKAMFKVYRGGDLISIAPSSDTLPIYEILNHFNNRQPNYEESLNNYNQSHPAIIPIVYE